MNSTFFSHTAILSFACSFGVFLFCALALVVPSGYSYGALLLVVLSVIYLFIRPQPLLQPKDYYFIAALFIYFLISSGMNFLQHLPSHSYDNPSRFLLAIPVLLLLIRARINVDFLWLGLSFGAIGACGIALWNFYIQGELRASGFTNAIQFGDISILFSCLLLSALPLFQTRTWLFRGAVTLGVVSGIVASLLSGARGGWLVLVVVAVWFLSVYGLVENTKNIRKNIITFLVALPIVLFVSLPGFLKERIQDGVADFSRYQQADDNTSSIGSRLHMWQRSMELIEVRPFMGWGTQESAVQYLNSLNIKDSVLASYNHVHNDFLDACVKRGIFGGLALLAIYVVPFLLFMGEIKKKNPLNSIFAIAGVTLVLSVATFGLTQTFFSHASGSTFYAFLLIILWSQTRSQNITDATNINSHNYPLNSSGEGN